MSASTAAAGTTGPASPAGGGPETVGGPGPRPSLLRAEARRLRSRRLVRVLFALGLLGLLTAIAVETTQYARPSAAALADAAQRRDAALAEGRQFHRLCLADPGRPPQVTPEQFCGPEPTAEQYGSVEDFVQHRPFALAVEGRDGVLGVGGLTAVLAFLLGASSIGAEWSTRSLVALLFWEPRRVRVMVTKVAVVAGVAAVLGLLAEAVWLGGAVLLEALRGDPGAAAPPGLWGELLGTAGRAVLLVVLAALCGFGVANLLRSTAAALGVGFVYFSVAEGVLRVLRPGWAPWLLTTSAAALLDPGGVRRPGAGARRGAVRAGRVPGHQPARGTRARGGRRCAGGRRGAAVHPARPGVTAPAQPRRARRRRLSDDRKEGACASPCSSPAWPTRCSRPSRGRPSTRAGAARARGRRPAGPDLLRADARQHRLPARGAARGAPPRARSSSRTTSWSRPSGSCVGVGAAPARAGRPAGRGRGAGAAGRGGRARGRTSCPSCSSTCWGSRTSARRSRTG